MHTSTRAPEMSVIWPLGVRWAPCRSLYGERHCTGGSTTTSLPRWWTQPHSPRGRSSARRRSPSTPRSSTNATSLADPRECPTHSLSTWWSLSTPTSWLPLQTPTRCNLEWRANARPMPARASKGNKLQKKKPASSKGVFIKKLFINSTMGPGLQVDPTSVM